MAQLVVRRLEELVKRRLQLRAKKNGRSMEEEARIILREAVGRTSSKEEKSGARASKRSPSR